MRILRILVLVSVLHPPLLWSTDIVDGVNAPITGDRKTKLTKLLPAAKAGDKDAQAAVGIVFYLEKNFPESLKWFNLSANSGHPSAQLFLGIQHAEGQGIKQNYEEALKYFQVSARQGLSAAQYRLSYLYYFGKGTPQNFTESARWARLAAEQGNPEGQYFLAAHYFSGEGINENKLLAHMWMNLAAAGGHPHAPSMRESYSAFLSKEEVSYAQEKAQQCVAQNYKNCD